MKIVAFMVLAAMVGCSRSDKTATVEQVSDVTVTSAPMTVPAVNADAEELDRRVVLAAARNLPVVIDAVGGMNAVATHQPGSDEQATFKIQLALVDDAYFTRYPSDIDVRVDDGIATLRGNTATPEGRTEAERIAMRYPGVVSVDNQLRVAPAAVGVPRTAPAHR
jgi:hypothetical protein